jgi:hypothetical protein
MVCGVATNELNTTTYERPDDVQTPAAADGTEATCPALFRAGAILFSVNLLILMGIWLSPELRVGMYGEETESNHSYYKPSAFTEVVDTTPARQVRAAARVRPVLFQDPAAAEFVESAEFILPRSTSDPAGTPQPATTAGAAGQMPVSYPSMERAQPVTGAALDRVVSSYSDFPRVTASIHRALPDASVHATTTDVAPRRLSEQVVRTAIN